MINQKIGVFRGSAGDLSYDFAAEVVIPYSSNEVREPQIGRFFLVELMKDAEYVLGRVTRFTPAGQLASGEAEDYFNRMQDRNSQVPEDLKQRFLKYYVNLKLLGVMRKHEEKIVYTPSQRRLPHLGAPVFMPAEKTMEEICRLGGGETKLGSYNLGEYIYDGNDGEFHYDHAGVLFHHKAPALSVTFNVENLIARRTAVFARAGYGKSNLIKLLLSELYQTQPIIPEGERKRKVGVLVFDADGEYFWPNPSRNRPGLCNVPQLKDSLHVFTNRESPDEDLGKWKAGGVKFDIRQLPAALVVSTVLTQEQQEQQNVRKLKSLKQEEWSALITAVADKTASLDKKEEAVADALKLKIGDVQVGTAQSNLAFIVSMLHDPNNKMMGGMMAALKEGNVVVVDLSLMSARGGEAVAGLMLKKIFSRNQEGFTKGDVTPVIAVIEEAQRVLGGKLSETSPFVEWVKEGRKYDLGAILVTQQPGALADELLSQVDNWFCFHLLSRGDVAVLEKYNSHFSRDILSRLIAEPMMGNCYMWSAPKQPFVLPLRVKSFDSEYDANQRPQAPEVSRQQVAAEDDSNREQAMAEKLKQLMREQKKQDVLGDVDFPNDLKGIKYGKLYYLIDDVKKEFPGEIRDANQLKMPLFKAVFGDDVSIEKRPENGIDYFCAPKAQWNKIFPS